MEETKPIIMVVDDQPDFIEGVKLILEVEGYEVWTASNGREALDRLQSVAEDRSKGFRGSLPDLILADIMMPVMDGYVLYEHTQKHQALENIPFVFLTAKTASEDLQYGKDLGIEDYLTKPCSPDVLLASVRGQLRGGKLPQQQIQYEERFQPVQTPQPGQEKASEKTMGNVNVILVILAVIGILIALVTFLTMTQFEI